MNQLTLPPMDILARSAKELAQSASDKRNEMALNNGMLDLHLGSVPVATAGGFLVRSSTRNVAYRVDNVLGCNCDAGAHGKPCRHAAQIEIIEDAQRHTMAVLPPLGQRLAKARSEMSELFS